MMTQSANKPFSEIIESSLQDFKAQCWQWDNPPSCGSLVTVQEGTKTLFALVYDVAMGSMDPVHYPFPYQKTHEELLKEQPQIFEFLKTTFSCLIIGFREKGRIHYLLPGAPPKIHSFVAPCPLELSKEFYTDARYLPLIFSFNRHNLAIDELLLSVIRFQRDIGCLSTAACHEFIETFSLLSGNDYRRLKLFLQRAQPLFEHYSDL